MKTLNFLTTGAAAAMLLLGSCTKDVDNPQGGGNGDGGVVEGIPTYATVTLSQRSGAGTYADPPTNPDYTKPESGVEGAEGTLNSAIVIVFNNFDIYETHKELANGQKSATFNTTTGYKTLLALGNLTDAAKKKVTDVLKENLKLSDFQKVVQQIASIDDVTKKTGADGADEGNFWMSNVYKLNATAEKKDLVGTDKDKNNFTIYIGRMIAKVTPSFDAKLNYGADAGGTLNTTGAEYRVRNNPTRFYTLPVYEGLQLMSPYYHATYPLDGTGGYKDADETKTLGAADFFDNTFVAMGANSYLTENSPQEAKRHKVTFLSIKAKWVPDENATFLNADGSKVADPKTDGADAIAKNKGTFWRVQKWQEGKMIGYCPGIYTAQPTAAHSGTEIGETANITDIETVRDDAITASMDRETPDDETSPYKVAYLAVEYTEGTAYWAYWMKNSNTGEIAQKYTLKRNNHFKVTISAVDGVGDPNEDDILDNDKEDIETNIDMTANIVVLDWNQVDIEGGI